MKNIVYILFIATFISGCDSNGLLEKIGLKDKITDVIQKRNDIAFLPNSDEPFTGRYKTYYSNGHEKAETNYKKGKANGFGTDWYENGQKTMEGNYIEGKANGLLTKWHVNGQKESEINFKDGKLNGLTINWYENGQKENETNYKDGEVSGLLTDWDENGKKKSEGNYINGKLNGLLITWYENGQKESEINSKDDNANGLAIEWYKNGQQKSEGNYINGKLNGLLIEWYGDGKKSRETNYIYGKVSHLDSNLSVKIGLLIAKVESLYDKCRGGSGNDDSTMKACSQTDDIFHEIIKLGWCWGNGDPEQAYFDKEWQECPKIN